MAAGCGASCARILLIVFNIIFWLSGAALLGIGIWMQVDDSIFSYIDVLGALSSDGQLVRYASYVLIGVGAFVLIVGFFGCCGALKENKCMLGTYIFLMVLVMAAEIAVGVLGIIFKDKILKDGASEFKKTVAEKYNQVDPSDPKFSEAFVEAVNYIQFNAKCCGWTDFSDFTTAIPAYEGITKDGMTALVPTTCCTVKPESRDNDNLNINNMTSTDLVSFEACASSNTPTDTTAFYDTGCEQKFKDWVDDNSIIIIGVGIGIACLELFGFIFAVCLCRNIEE